MEMHCNLFYYRKENMYGSTNMICVKSFLTEKQKSNIFLGLQKMHDTSKNVSLFRNF